VYAWMAFNPATGLPNEHAPEQVLAAYLGSTIEMIDKPKGITLVRLDELFRAVLHADVVDETLPADRQVRRFLDGADEFVAITDNVGAFRRILPRVMGLNAIVRSLSDGPASDMGAANGRAD